jgi:hypothetical protein
MKRRLSIQLSVLSFVVFLILACQKNEIDDPNQPLIDQLKAVTDSLVKNTDIPGIVALVSDKKRGIDWLSGVIPHRCTTVWKTNAR